MTRLRTWGLWFEFRWGQDIFLFSKNVQISSGAHPALYSIGSRDMKLTTSLHLVRRLRKSEAPSVVSDKLTFKFFSRYYIHFCSLSLSVLSFLCFLLHLPLSIRVFDFLIIFPFSSTLVLCNPLIFFLHMSFITRDSYVLSITLHFGWNIWVSMDLHSRKHI
jgi:hypothetical protein